MPQLCHMQAYDVHEDGLVCDSLPVQLILPDCQCIRSGTDEQVNARPPPCHATPTVHCCPAVQQIDAFFNFLV